MTNITNFSDIDQFRPEVTEVNETSLQGVYSPAGSLCDIIQPGVFGCTC